MFTSTALPINFFCSPACRGARSYPQKHILGAGAFGQGVVFLDRKIPALTVGRIIRLVKRLPEYHRELFGALPDRQDALFGLTKGQEYRSPVTLDFRKHEQRQKVRAGIPLTRDVAGKETLAVEPRLLPCLSHGFDFQDQQLGEVRRDLFENLGMSH